MRTFKIGSEEIKFDDDFEFYNHYVNDLFAIAYESMHIFENEIAKIDDINKLIDETPEIANSLINEAVSYCIDVLIDNEIYDYDVKRFWEEYGDIIDYEESEEFQELNGGYQSIQTSERVHQEEKDSYRNSRSHWEGGGFGISGAIKGAINAGALNMVTGAYRGLVDSFVDSSDRRKFNKMRNALLTEENLDSLAQGLWNNIAAFVTQSLAQILEERTGRNADRILRRGANKAEAIFNNLDRIKDSDKQRKLIKEIIELDPYELSYLAYFEDNSDRIGLDQAEILEIFQYLNAYGYQCFKMDKISEELESITNNTELSPIEKRDKITEILVKNKYIDINYNILIQDNNIVISEIEGFIGLLAIYEIRQCSIRFRGKNELSYYDRVELKNTIEESLKKYRILKSYKPVELKEEYVDMFTGIIELLNKTKKQILIDEKEIRTVRGREFATIEEAECYRKEVSRFDTICSEARERKTSQQFSDLIQKLKNEKFQSKEICDYIVQLEKEQKRLEKEEKEQCLTVGKIKFETFEEADCYRKEKEKWDKKLDNCKEYLGLKPLVTQDIDFVYKELMAEGFTSKILLEKLNIILKIRDIYQKVDSLKAGTRLTEEKQYIICESCGSRINPCSKFCPMCGKPIVMKITCPKCGYKCESSAKFCGMCGNKLM